VVVIVGKTHSGWVGEVQDMKILSRCVAAVLALSLVPLAYAATENVLYDFGGSDGMEPYSVPVLDAQGNFFGTTMLGGANNAGIVFELSPTQNGQWFETILHEFTGGSDGENPSAGLVFDHKGDLFGTAGYGGANGSGVVFELSPQGSGWTYSVLYSFGAYPQSGDGFGPNSPVVFDKKGNLYGITNEGGGSGCFEGCGTVFELSPNGSGGWTEQLIHRFSPDGTDGELPTGGVSFDVNGDLYGTTQNGGAAGSGVLYQLKYSSTTQDWSEQIVHQFIGGSNDGSFPINVILIADHEGDLYGTTDGGGANGFGTVFEATFSRQTGWNTTILYSFKETYSGDGNSPHAGVAMDKDGNLYGTTSEGGAYDYYGTVFRLSKSNNWAETILHSFSGSGDGFNPEAGVVLHDDSLYGTTDLGGASSFGIAYQIK
jgi:uncharacterized repeat protein (TIGR03803 family)